MRMRKSYVTIILIVCGWSPIAWACPKLSGFYPEDTGMIQSWELARDNLAKIYDQCLRNSEYFALYGAAHLNSGGLGEAIESLERALLLDPDNGAALIDYADALLRDGQLFAAIEANTLLLARTDVPPDLKLQIDQRQQNWAALTKQTSWQLDLSGGYDDNLNGAPDEDLVELTLSGEPIFLSLKEQYKAVEGEFLNARLQARHRRLTPDFQHSFIGQIRSRVSDDASSDVAQLAGRYNRLKATGRNSLEWGAGVNHLIFGNRSLFTGTDFGGRYQLGSIGRCRSQSEVALQHQVWHQQRRLDGLEAKVGVGASCPLSSEMDHRLNLEGSILHNSELSGDRLGGDREGWQVSANWQMTLPLGSLLAQFNYTRLIDESGFNALLASNARRAVKRSSLLIQFRRAFDLVGSNGQLVMSFYHQNQRSNLGLFQTQDTSAEIGLSWRF